MKISNFKNLNEISYFQFQKFNKEEHLYFNNPNLKKLEIYTWTIVTGKQIGRAHV